MKKTYRFFFFLFLTGSISKILAQDFHLSQYDANPLYLNPALTGMYLDETWNYRAIVNYREQWNKLLNIPYSTIATSFDLPIGERFSVGEYILNNKAGNGAINTFNLQLSGSYKISATESDDPHHLSVGVQCGLLQKSFNAANFTFDSQYSASSADGFDRSLSNGENFVQSSLFRFDANLGIFYRYINKDAKFSPFGSFAIYHITRPDESFTGEVYKTPMRFSFNTGVYYSLTEKLKFLPIILIQNQAKVTELNLGIQSFYRLNSAGYQFFLGSSWRRKDALIIHTGVKYVSWFARISYDMNISYLKNYSYGRGGLEFSLIYTGKKKKVKERASF